MDSKGIKSISLTKKGQLGRQKKHIIDEDKNENIVNLVKLITDKSKCEDLFLRLKLNDEFVYD